MTVMNENAEKIGQQLVSLYKFWKNGSSFLRFLLLISSWKGQLDGSLSVNLLYKSFTLIVWSKFCIVVGTLWIFYRIFFTSLLRRNTLPTADVPAD